MRSVKVDFPICKPLLKDNGVYISTELGPGFGKHFLSNQTSIHLRKKLLFPLPSFTQEDIKFLKKQYEEGHFKPLIDRVYEFDQIIEAYTYVETGQKNRECDSSGCIG